MKAEMRRKEILAIVGNSDNPLPAAVLAEKLGVLGETGNGWTKELNLVSWNEREPVYDIRTWNENHDRMGKGITLSLDEIKSLKDLLDGMDI